MPVSAIQAQGSEFSERPKPAPAPGPQLAFSPAEGGGPAAGGATSPVPPAGPAESRGRVSQVIPS